MNRRELFIGAGAVALATALPALPALAAQPIPTWSQIYALAEDEIIWNLVGFEFNDTLTRHAIMKYVTTKLGPCNDNWHMVCDDSNNDFGVINKNHFVLDIYAKPQTTSSILNKYRITWGPETVIEASFSPKFIA